jgi:hypothetical protein
VELFPHDERLTKRVSRAETDKQRGLAWLLTSAITLPVSNCVAFSSLRAPLRAGMKPAAGHGSSASASGRSSTPYQVEGWLDRHRFAHRAKEAARV